jgi:hypothetical protein
MQVEAIYDHGKIELIAPLHLKHGKVRVMVTVPDNEIETKATYNLPQEVIDRAKTTRARMDAVLHPPLPQTMSYPI